MSIIAGGPEAQDSLFNRPPHEIVPDSLVRATSRLEFPPSYVIVGVYRLCTDKLLYQPAWEKCRNGTRRGAAVGLVWTILTFGIQKKFLEYFLANSPRVTGLSDGTLFGYKIPFSVHTYATLMLVGSQVTFITRFFLSRNIRIARDRVWAQTVASRGYGADFWGPYVEEWDAPPVVEDSFERRFTQKWLGGWIGRFVVKRVLLLPFNFVPFLGIVVSAWLRGLTAAEYLHTRYFKAKNMTAAQTAIFIEERKWDYRTFGFTASLLEGLPFIGLFFSVSNRVGAAMWAYDLEKRQHFVASQKGLKAKPVSVGSEDRKRERMLNAFEN